SNEQIYSSKESSEQIYYSEESSEQIYYSEESSEQVYYSEESSEQLYYNEESNEQVYSNDILSESLPSNDISINSSRNASFWLNYRSLLFLLLIIVAISVSAFLMLRERHARFINLNEHLSTSIQAVSESQKTMDKSLEELQTIIMQDMSDMEKLNQSFQQIVIKMTSEKDAQQK
ncbi:MAG: hypothetical protein HQK67_00005, partial [Desulfamplus sp.]|nr:hypothetical protein [Desulfamplus sp.]